MDSFIRTLAIMAIAALVTPCALADDAPSDAPRASTAKTHIKPMQPWQQRRMEFIETVKALRDGKESARNDFNAALTEFETRVMARTPIENMEIIGVFYVAKDGIEKTFPVIVMNAVLGWYDVLRFASASGRAEILHKESFFRLAFLIGGQEGLSRAMKFAQDNPERAAELVEKGLSYAEKFRDTSNYDRRWPAAYGMDRTRCDSGLLDPGKCEVPAALPNDQWNKAWLEARTQVASFYQAKKPAVSGGSASTRSSTASAPLADEGLPPGAIEKGTFASAKLIQDAMLGVAVKVSTLGCRQLDGLDHYIHAMPSGAAGHRHWSELWVVSGCSSKYPVKIEFKEDGASGANWAIGK
jgi:hypothetical protein